MSSSQSIYSNDSYNGASNSPESSYNPNYYGYNNSNQLYDTTNYSSSYNSSYYQNVPSYYNNYYNYANFGNYSYMQDSINSNNYSVDSSSSSYYSTANVSPYTNYSSVPEPVIKQSTPTNDSIQSQISNGVISVFHEKEGSEVKSKCTKKSGRNLVTEFGKKLGLVI